MTTPLMQYSVIAYNIFLVLLRPSKQKDEHELIHKV